MRITVTPEDNHPTDGHPDSFHSSGEPFIGRYVVVNSEGVLLDGVHVIRRDRRSKLNRTPGHPWVTLNGHPDPRYEKIGWTSFRVDVEP